MKKIAALTLTLLFLFSGCRIPDFSDYSAGNPPADALSDVGDSTVRFAIYPDGCEVVGKFERTQFPYLTDVQKSIYIRLDNAVFSMETGYIGVGNCTYRDLELAYHALKNDRPEYFWLPRVYTVRSYENRQEICLAETENDWLYTAAERAETEAFIKTELTKIAETVTNFSEYERELAAHDWLIDRIDYDYGAADDREHHMDAWSIVGGIVDKSAVCEGYSRSMQVLCFMMGLNCGLVTGTTSGAHMWNTVKVDGEWYHVDLTNDDGKDVPYHFFFNVTTEYLLKGRAIDPDFAEITEERFGEDTYNAFLPECRAGKDNYFIRNSLYVTDASRLRSAFISAVCAAARDGRNLVEICFSPEVGFVFGQDDPFSLFDITGMVSAANAELDPEISISTYVYSGIEGALGFMIYW